MSWVKIDDQFVDHPKVVAAGPLAAWLYVCGLTYCGRYLTDGWIPRGQVHRLADVEDTQALADRLVSVGLWEEVDDGYLVHDYLIYNPTAQKVKAARDLNTQRQAEWRDKHRDSDGQFAVDDAQRNGSVTPLVTPLVTHDVTPPPSPSPSPSPSQIPVPVEDISGSPEREPEPAPVPNRRSDPRSKHPAIIAARAATGAKHYPPIELYDGLIQALGENPDTAKLSLCRQSWVERGYNPGAWTWATEWYATGVPTKGARASPGGNGHAMPRGEDAIEAWLKSKEGIPHG